MTELKNKTMLGEDSLENSTILSTAEDILTIQAENNIEDEVFVTGLTTYMDEKMAQAGGGSGGYKAEEKAFQPRNRAERRAWERELKKKDKKKRVFADNIRQAAERLAYIEMIQRVRKINEEIEKEGAQENEAAN